MRLVALLFAFMLAFVMFYPLPGFAAGVQSHSKAKIRMVFTHEGVVEEVIVGMLDNPASQEFMGLLPLTLEFNDYVRTEKIAYLPNKLKTKKSTTGRETNADFTYYAPWGNLAVFYNGFGGDSQLYALGYIESGKESLAKMNSSFTATITLVSK